MEEKINLILENQSVILGILGILCSELIQEDVDNTKVLQEILISLIDQAKQINDILK